MKICAALLALSLIWSGEATAKECRALINFSEEQPNGSTPKVIDLRLGATPKASVHRHEYAVGFGKTIRLLRTRLSWSVKSAEVQSEDGPYGVSTESTWSTIMARSPGGPSVVLYDDQPRLELPDPEDGSAASEGTHLATLTGIFNGFVSFSMWREGYAGGMHGYDSSNHLTFTPHAPEKPVNVARLVGARGVRAMAKAIDVEEELRGEVGFEGVGRPKATADNLQHGSFMLRQGGGLDLVALLFCCTWVENHNLVEIRAPLSKPPKALRSAVPNAKGWFRGPCGRLKVAKGKLSVKSRGRSHTLKVDATGTLMGLAWVDADAPALDPAPPDVVGHAGALARGRALLEANQGEEALPFLDAAKHLRPDHPPTLSAAGWARFKLGKLEGAQLDLQRAAELTKDSEQSGAILYNLGRVAEARGDRTAAKAHYRASLKARPGNKVVKERLDGLK